MTKDIRDTAAQGKGESEDEGCPLAECLSFLAGAWTPEILWYLQNDARRFGDLKRDLVEVSSKVLTTRLRELEERGVISRTVLPTSPPTVEYALTKLGEKLQPVLKSIADVGTEIKAFQKKKQALRG